jgi:hypothetical protein
MVDETSRKAKHKELAGACGGSVLELSLFDDASVKSFGDHLIKALSSE